MSGYGSAGASRQGHGAAGQDGSGRSPQVYPHMLDLQAKAQARINNLNPHITMGHLLGEAEQAANQTTTLLEYRRRPDLAFLEYLVASELIVSKIPRHKDWPILQADRGNMYRKYRELQKRVQSQDERFQSIKEIIKMDNKRSGVQPSSGVPLQRPSTPNGTLNGSSAAPNQSVLPLSVERSGTSNINGVEDDTASSSAHLSGRSTPMQLSGSSSPKPPVRPKPDALHGRAIAQNGMLANGTAGQQGALALQDRFARLRMSNPQPDTYGNEQRPNSRGSVRSVAGENSAALSTDPSFATSLAPLSYVSSAPPSTTSSSRPLGPRSMPSALPGPPPHPPKLPLDANFIGTMPKPPSPAYSPARNMQTPANINPPRSTARSMVGSGGRSNSMTASSIASQPPGVNGEAGSYIPGPANGAVRGNAIRRKSVNLSSEDQIDARKLYDYVQIYDVLLIDVRTREEFDEGHIWRQTVMCVEPTALRDNMSAEELADSLVISPEYEQMIFDRRDRFDLVVYYDQSTATTSFLERPNRNESETSLKRLYDALCVFNEEKPLKRPPILLRGGIEAWCELLGRDALQTSNTAVQQSARAAKPVIRRPPMTGDRLYVQKKRHREYNPLDPEEERKWLERARSESLAIEARPPDEADEDAIEDGDIVPILRTTEDFFRRFPEASSIEQQSMISPPSRPPPPPSYQPPPIPTVPSRPAPAAPRVSYSGVHDRNAPPAIFRSSHLPSYIPSSQLAQNIRLPRTGLINFGVTCYMNATIQSLNATIPLTRIFQDGTYRKYIQRDNWKGSRGLIPEHYANLILNLWKGDVTACRPSTFRNFCARLNREWGLDRQQDAKEFLDFLVDYLHEDFNINWNNPPAHVLTAQEEQMRERMPKPYAARIEWSRWSKRERSVISDLFAGQHASRLRCRTCGFTSTTFETFFSISIEIPRSGTGNIYDCLRSYCSEERLAGDEVWKCPNCKKEREATKQITLTRAPRYLVVHFKRFSAGHHESARKVRTPIEFPLNGLDITPFMLPPPTPEEERRYAKERPSDSTPQDVASDVNMKSPFIYHAYAVMRHIGNTLSSGHYISLVKDPGRGCWRQFNDDKVNDFDPEGLAPSSRLQNEQAYIVFYEREDGR